MSRPAVQRRSADPDLVARARAGDRAAWADLHRRYVPMVHAICLAHAPYREVEDLVQDVFVRGMEKLGALREDRAFGGWLARIARNRAMDAVRRRRRLAPLPLDLTGPTVPAVEAREALAAVRTLPEAYRETLLMRLVEGMSGREIAARTGLTPASVRVNLHRGMKRLRAALQAETGSES